MIIKRYSTQGLACMVYGLGLMGIGDTNVWKPIYEQIQRKGLHSFSEHELVNIIIGLSALESLPVLIPTKILDYLINDRKLKNMSSRDISTLVLAIGLMKSGHLI